MQKIIPHFWFDTQAVEAAKFYASVFPNSAVTQVTTIPGTPSGDADIVNFTVMGCECMAISGGPAFAINPSISMMLNFDPSRMPDARAKIDEIWAKLIDGGQAMMPLDKYPFSERYGWVKDKFGLTWQLILTNPEGEERPVVVPSLLFTQEHNAMAEAATEYYLSVFKNAKRGTMAKYPADDGMHKPGDVMFTDVLLEGQWFAAMDGGTVHSFTFNEAVSFIVNCADQAEIDYFTEKLSAVPASEQCGWVKDQFGVSWQILPANMGELMGANMAKTVPALLAMKKIDIAALKAAASV